MKRYVFAAALGLVLLAVAGRLLPHAANVTPLYAVALFACAVLPRRWAIVVPVIAMIASDFLIGLHNGIFFTWSGMLVFAVLGFGLRGRTGNLRIVGSALAGSLVFFLWTNLGVWLTGGLYPQTATGLVHCYVAALPFFRNSLLGDLAFSGVLFAAWQWVVMRHRMRAPVVAPAT